MKDTVVLGHETEAATGEVRWIVAGHASDAPPSEFPATDCYRYAGQYIALVIAYIGIPSLLGRRKLPTRVFFSATHETMGRTMQEFAELLRDVCEAQSWSGEVLVASSARIWKVTRNFTVEESAYPHAVIGERASAVASALRSAEQWAGVNLPALSVPGLIAGSITRAWKALSDTPKSCTLTRHSV